MHLHGVARLDLGQAFALVVQDVHDDCRGGVDHHQRGTTLGALLLDAAQHMDRAALDAADMAEAVAMRAGDEVRLGQARAQALAAHFHQAEMADLADLDARAVVLQRLLEAALDHGVVLLRLHVDEVDDDQPGEIAQPQLARHLVGGLQVGLDRGLLDAALARGAAGVDVDGDQRLGLVDDQIAAGFELHGGRQHRVELCLDAHRGEQRLAVAGIAAGAPGHHLAGMGRHQHAHEVMRCLPALLAIDEHFVDIAGIAVTDGALDQARLLVDQRGGHRLQRVLADIVPQAHQIFAVAADFRLRPGGAGGPHDQAHALGDFQFGGDLLEPAAVGGRGDLAGNPTTARRVRHQHAEAAGERDISGQGRALGAALLLDDLDEHDLAAVDDFLDAIAAQEAGGAALAGLLGAVAFEDIALAADGLRCRLIGGGGVEIAGIVAGIVGGGVIWRAGRGGFGFPAIGRGKVEFAVGHRMASDFAMGDFAVGDFGSERRRLGDRGSVGRGSVGLGRDWLL